MSGTLNVIEENTLFQYNNTFISIDPGIRKYGYCIFKYQNQRTYIIAVGDVINTSSLISVFNNLHDLFISYKPEKVILEKIFMNSNPKTSFFLNSARTIVVLLCEMLHIDLFEINATSVKKKVLNNGHATKEQVQQFVLDNFGFTIDNNGADAVIIGQSYVLDL